MQKMALPCLPDQMRNSDHLYEDCQSSNFGEYFIHISSLLHYILKAGHRTLRYAETATVSWLDIPFFTKYEGHMATTWGIILRL